MAPKYRQIPLISEGGKRVSMKIGPEHSAYMSLVQGHFNLAKRYGLKAQKAKTNLLAMYTKGARAGLLGPKANELDLVNHEEKRGMHLDTAAQVMRHAVENTLEHNGTVLFGEEHDIAHAINKCVHEGRKGQESPHEIFVNVMNELWENNHIMRE